MVGSIFVNQRPHIQGARGQRFFFILYVSNSFKTQPMKCSEATGVATGASQNSVVPALGSVHATNSTPKHQKYLVSSLQTELSTGQGRPYKNLPLLALWDISDPVFFAHCRDYNLILTRGLHDSLSLSVSDWVSTLVTGPARW